MKINRILKCRSLAPSIAPWPWPIQNSTGRGFSDSVTAAWNGILESSKKHSILLTIMHAMGNFHEPRGEEILPDKEVINKVYTFLKIMSIGLQDS
ncbi:MAG: hypothetical protein PVG99_13115 [Desulfobacteraceae bacterium]|jgi:hypothetical protein